MLKRILLSGLLLIVLGTVQVKAQFAGGSGTEEDPYQISTVDQLQEIQNHLDKHFVQTNDIDGIESSNWNWEGGTGFKPIGDETIKFIGSYDGNNYKILNLTIIIDQSIHTIDRAGIFGVTGTEAIIKNVNIENIELLNDDTVGALVALNNGMIKNCFSSGTIKDTEYDEFYIGGLIGINNGSIYDSYSIINITLDKAEAIGGLVGLHNEGLIKNSYAEGSINVTGGGRSSSLGGLVGKFNDGEIIDSYAIGDVLGNNSLGGLAGNMSGTIKNSYSTGLVTGNNNTGGLVGFGRGTIINSYSNNNVNGNSNNGGLVGEFGGNIQNSKAVGDVISQDGDYVGGLVGYLSGTIQSSHADGNVTATNSLRVGGLVGHVINGNGISNSYSVGNVFGKNVVGGLVGSIYGKKVNNSFATGDVTGSNIVGGLVGRNDSEAAIYNSYARGNIEGEESIGGLVGINQNNSLVSKSYSSGMVSGTTDIGGLVGVNGASIDKSFWDTENSNTSDGVGSGYSNGITGLNTEQMVSTRALENMSGLDFENTWSLTEGYPALYWEDVESIPLPPSQITLLKPEAEATNIQTNDEFSWMSDQMATSYEITIAPDSNFTSPVVDSTLSDTVFTLENQLEYDTTYYWRVKTINESGESDWSEAWSFTTIIANPDMVELVLPINEDLVPIDNPFFEWTSSEIADSYYFQLTQDEQFESVDFDTTLSEPDTSFTLPQILDEEQYFWRVRAENESGTSDWSEAFWFTGNGGLSLEEESLPTEFTLNQNYPNPFNPSTQIRYGIPQAAEVELSVFNMLGQKVATLVSKKQSAGWHTATFNASGLSSGFYIYRIQAGEFVSTKKLMLIK